jgi:DNA polymerase V
VWDGVRADKLQIFLTLSIGKRITNIGNLNQALSKHVGIATVKATDQQSLCGTLMAFVSNSLFDEKLLQLQTIKIT